MSACAFFTVPSNFPKVIYNYQKDDGQSWNGVGTSRPTPGDAVNPVDTWGILTRGMHLHVGLHAYSTRTLLVVASWF